jgi:hypothetical protein
MVIIDIVTQLNLVIHIIIQKKKMDNEIWKGDKSTRCLVKKISFNCKK